MTKMLCMQIHFLDFEKWNYCIDNIGKVYSVTIHKLIMPCAFYSVL